MESLSGGNQTRSDAARVAPSEWQSLVTDRQWQALSDGLSVQTLIELHSLLTVASPEVRAGLLREVPALMEEYGDRSVFVALGRISYMPEEKAAGHS